MGIPFDNRWCILRTAGPRTISLTWSLCRAGIAAWTPSQVRSIRRGRHCAITTEVPLLPTFVFAPAADLSVLGRLAIDPLSPHPQFSLFRWGDGVVTISEPELHRLAEAEDALRPKPIAPAGKRAGQPIAVGSEVRIPEGPFGGMTGVVQQSDGRMTLVAFGNILDVKIETFLLQESGVLDTPALTGTAA